jgi:hypothetical protein
MADKRYAEIVRIEFYQNLTSDLKLYMENPFNGLMKSRLYKGWLKIGIM